MTVRIMIGDAREQLRVAVNSEFSDWTRTLRPGDALVFIPPVAGG